MANPAVTLRRAFIAASVLWAAAIPTAAVASALATPAVPVYLFTVAVYATGAAVCHQLAERSFQLWGRQLPVCARCTGIYAATALAVVGFTWARRRNWSWSSRGRTLRLGAGALALALNGLTLVYEWATGVTPSNVVRAAAGAALGAVVAALIVNDVD